MKIVQGRRVKEDDWIFTNDHVLSNPLVLVFGSRFLLEKEDIYAEIRSFFPNGHLVFGTTSGEIFLNRVFDDSVTFTAIEFEKGNFIVHTENILSHKKNAVKAGKALGKKFPEDNLKHLFVISEGSFVNGSDLITGLESQTLNKIPITGGLCGDGSRFEKTLASYNEKPKEGEIVVVGFYGDTLEITFAYGDGWIPFGPERTITKSSGNILWEIDNIPALNIYKNFLGEKASELPEAALFYPLSVKTPGSDYTIGRTILNIDEKNNTMIMAGDVPEGSLVQLTMAHVDNMSDAVIKASEIAMKGRKKDPEIGLLTSCFSRKLVMDQRVEEEVEEVQYGIGADVAISGFYSYGEIVSIQGKSILLNQTLTLTLISE